MSWMKRAATAAAPADPAGHVAPQAYGNDQSMYPNYQQGNAQGSLPQQQQYWGMLPPQHTQQPAAYNQMYGQVYQQNPNYAPNNANHMYQPYNQNYSNQSYNTPQAGYQQNYYQNQPVQQNFNQAPPANAKQDGWEDNWDWGWEESAKQAKLSQQQQAAQPPDPQQTQTYGNANVIEESFASNDTWNWAMDDKKDKDKAKQVPISIANQNHPPVQLPTTLNPQVGLTTGALELSNERNVDNLSTQIAAEEVRTLNDKELVQERLPNLAVGKRFHLENLTPQWSIESQMSQESSDGVQTHSESASYANENQSRNSNASPVNVDQFNSQLDQEETLKAEWSKHSEDEVTLRENAHKTIIQEDSEDITNSLQEMSIASRDTLSRSSIHSLHSNHDEANSVPENTMPSPSSHPAPSIPPPPVSSVLPPPSSLPSNFPSGTNPFKNAGGFSHKTTSKNATSIPSANQFSPMTRDAHSPLNPNLSSPSAVNKIQHSRPPVGFSANLETTPDNSERPDQPQVSPFRPMQMPPQVPDNLEVAPQNDRNEYLQTAHLSSVDYRENTDFSRNVPPLGLRRMVVGQQESEYGQSLNLSGDEPPPGLARMVPGQQTETDNSYQVGDSYMDRQIDGQPTDGDCSARPYRQAEGQQAEGGARGSRPVGLARLVPGEGGADYSQYQPGFHEYIAGPSDIREQNVDGSDYTEHTPRSIPRSIISSRETADVPLDFGVSDDQREVTMEGENLQDLSLISTAESPYSRDQTLDGADLNVSEGVDRKTDASDSLEIPTLGSRRQSFNRTSEEDSERDRVPKRDRDKHKSNKDRDRDRERDSRYSRDDKKKERDGDRRRSDKERKDRDRERDRRERDDSGDERRHRRSTRSHRYETEDTDYYSDRERERRRYREGSYASKPPRPDDKDRRYRDDRDRNRRYNTIERDRRYDDERDGAPRSRRSDRDRNRYERKYRDIDPARKYGNLRRDDDERRRAAGELPPSPRGSRECTDEEPEAEARRRERHRRSRHHRHEPRYDAYGGSGGGPDYPDPYELQRRQYQYYEHLRLTDPPAYMQLYKKLMAGEQPYVPPAALYGDLYGSLGYEGRPDESRGSVHSGRSSAALAGHGTYSEYGRYLAGRAGCGGWGGGGTPLDQRSLRTDLSDRDFTTDASLNLQLDESTVRSERMTPFKYATAHVKGNISQGQLVVVVGGWPGAGVGAAPVRVLDLAATLRHDPAAAELAGYPGPLDKGVTHKKSVIEYCHRKASGGGGGADPIGYVLMWELLALLLTQNGMVMGTDIADLLMKNTREYEDKPPQMKAVHNVSRRGSSERSHRASATSSAASPAVSPAPAMVVGDYTPVPPVPESTSVQDQTEALERLRELLVAGDRQLAIEWAMSRGLWAHALYLCWWGGARARGTALQRYTASMPRHDVLHSLYCALAGAPPPAAACVADARWADWRPHAAILLSNGGARPDFDYRTMVQFGDSLASRGLVYSAQFCYLSCGVPFSRHPLAPLAAPSAPAPPPRLSLLLADPKAPTLATFATNEAIFATEVYEYARSLNQDYVIDEFVVYKYLLATRLADCGQYSRALAYTERAARLAAARPAPPPALVARLAALAERLQYHEPLLEAECAAEGEGAGGGSPRHGWHQDLQLLAHTLQSEHNSPAHVAAAPLDPYAAPGLAPVPVVMYDQPQWTEQTQNVMPEPRAASPAGPASVPMHYNYQYGELQHNMPQQPEGPPPGDAPPPAAPPQYSYSEDWYQGHGDEQNNTSQYGTTYWKGDNSYQYAETERPAITMPGAAAAAAARPALYADYEDEPNQQPTEQTDSGSSNPKVKKEESKPKDGGAGKGGWLGGILTKLSLRPPNQMILPDDKNPSIVWDADTKRWRNVAGEEQGEGDDPQPPPPPPRVPTATAAANLQPSPSGGQAATLQGTPAAPVANIFKMQKSRHIKKSYVDVFNPSGAPSPALPAPAPAPPLAAAPTYFVPASPAGHHQQSSGSEFLSEQVAASSTDESQWTQ